MSCVRPPTRLRGGHLGARPDPVPSRVPKHTPGLPCPSVKAMPIAPHQRPVLVVPPDLDGVTTPGPCIGLPPALPRVAASPRPPSVPPPLLPPALTGLRWRHLPGPRPAGPLALASPPALRSLQPILGFIGFRTLRRSRPRHLAPLGLGLLPSPRCAFAPRSLHSPRLRTLTRATHSPPRPPPLPPVSRSLLLRPLGCSSLGTRHPLAPLVVGPPLVALPASLASTRPRRRGLSTAPCCLPRPQGPSVGVDPADRRLLERSRLPPGMLPGLVLHACSGPFASSTAAHCPGSKARTVPRRSPPGSHPRALVPVSRATRAWGPSHPARGALGPLGGWGFDSLGRALWTLPRAVPLLGGADSPRRLFRGAAPASLTAPLRSTDPLSRWSASQQAGWRSPDPGACPLLDRAPVVGPRRRCRVSPSASLLAAVVVRRSTSEEAPRRRGCWRPVSRRPALPRARSCRVGGRDTTPASLRVASSVRSACGLPPAARPAVCLALLPDCSCHPGQWFCFRGLRFRRCTRLDRSTARPMPRKAPTVQPATRRAPDPGALARPPRLPPARPPTLVTLLRASRLPIARLDSARDVGPSPPGFSPGRRLPVQEGAGQRGGFATSTTHALLRSHVKEPVREPFSRCRRQSFRQRTDLMQGPCQVCAARKQGVLGEPGGSSGSHPDGEAPEVHPWTLSFRRPTGRPAVLSNQILIAQHDSA